MSGEERNTVIERFNRDTSHRALILSLRAGGVGLNLQSASYVFHIDRWWNPAVERQAEDRAHRLGQVYPVTVIKYTCVGTIEERIEQILSAKQQLFDDIVDDVSFNLSARLSRDDLFALFDVPAPAREVKTADLVPQMSPAPELIARCQSILGRQGWAIKLGNLDLEFTGEIDIIASRSDELGQIRMIYMACRNDGLPVGVDALQTFLDALPANADARPIMAAPAGMTPEAADVARHRNVSIWDVAALNRLEQLG